MSNNVNPPGSVAENIDPIITFDLSNIPNASASTGQPFFTLNTSRGHAVLEGFSMPLQWAMTSDGQITIRHPKNLIIWDNNLNMYYPVIASELDSGDSGKYVGTVLIMRNPEHLEIEDESGKKYYPMQYLVNNDNSGISAIDENTTTYGHINPIYQGEETTKKIYFGTSTYRFGGIYLGASPNVSSDKNLKTNISPFDSRYDNAYLNIEPVTYMWKNLRSGDSHDRLHYGFLAQDIEKAFNDAGITTEEMGFLCRDVLERPNEAGEIVEYSMRYEELIALNTHMTQKALRKINELEAEIAELKLEINKLSNNNL